jgi:AcrR family transcriptional regulator
MEQTTESDGKKRTYHSRMRQCQAEETRQRNLEAAHSQFESYGYAVVTLEAIAEVAEASPKTIAVVSGSKRALLAAVINPDAFSTPVQQPIEELRETEDSSRHLSLVARLTRQAYEPLASSLELLRIAGAVAPELADLAQQVEERQRQNQDRLIASLHKEGALRHDLYRMLVVKQGWEPVRYEMWLARLLAEHLLVEG